MQQEPTIIFEDDSMMVVGKPAGMTVNNSETTNSQITLQDWIVAKYKREGKEIPDDGVSEFHGRAGIAHRLDKETSGVMLVAKTIESFLELQRQFKERLVSKTYLTLAHGSINPKEGEINVPIGRLEFNRKRFGVIAGGRESVTHYKVLEEKLLKVGKKSEPLSFLEVYPKTGRTHQIRVHLKHLNHPIFSDMLYAGRKTARDDRNMLPRVFLHAASIIFYHPVSKEQVTFTCPLASELQKFLDSLPTA